MFLSRLTVSSGSSVRVAGLSGSEGLPASTCEAQETETVRQHAVGRNGEEIVHVLTYIEEDPIPNS